LTAPALPAAGASAPRRNFQEEVIAATPGRSRLEMCIQCGTCGGSCPSAADMDHTPRQIFAMIRAGMRDEVLRSSTPWMCVSCYYCVVRCPQEVHITDLMYTLKGMAAAKHLYPNSTAPDFSKTFIGNVERYGRSFEVGLVARHYLRHFVTRLPGMAPVGLGMVSKGRMGFIPHRIKGTAQLGAILARAKENEASGGKGREAAS
jgi:heterodisulfide reductase subunit C